MDTKLGEQLPAEKRKHVPVSFSLNSKSNENGKRSDLRRSCWIGSGLNLNTCETGECSNISIGASFFADIHKRVRESPLVLLTSSSLADPSPPKPEALLSVAAAMSIALHAENHASVMAMGVDDGEIVVGQIETLGSLAKPLVVARCTVSDGFSVEETMLNPDSVYEKFASQSEIVGCLVELSLEMVGIGLGLKQLEAHYDYNLSLMNTSPGNFSGPFSSSLRSDFEGNFSIS